MERVVTVLGWLWMLPLTLAGLLAALVGRARYSHASGALLFVAVPGGLCAWFFERFRMAAFTWGGVIVVDREELLASAGLMRHELVHVRQAMALGILLPVAYCVASLVAVAQGGDAYRDNWFERRAREEA